MWTLIDDRAGNTNQTLGVAKALDLPFTKKNVIYNKFVKLPNFIRGKSLIGVDNHKEILSSLSEKPNLVIGSGRRLAPVARFIKKMSPGTKIVSIMWPGAASARDFDLIALPLHDKKIGSNIIHTFGAPNVVTPDSLQNYVNGPCYSKFSHLPKPQIAVLIGGSTKKGTFTQSHAQTILNGVKDKGSLLVTTSRRTSTEVTKFIKDSLISTSSPHYFYDGNGENPYMEFLANCDVIVVTGDSVSMCSESCSTGKPVYIYSPKDIISSKHIEFTENLFKAGYAKPLFQGISQNTEYYPPLKDSITVAEAIKKMMEV